jgi:hypothetical protein
MDGGKTSASILNDSPCNTAQNIVYAELHTHRCRCVVPLAGHHLHGHTQLRSTGPWPSTFRPGGSNAAWLANVLRQRRSQMLASGCCGCYCCQLGKPVAQRAYLLTGRPWMMAPGDEIMAERRGLGPFPGSGPVPLDANSRQQGRSRSLGQLVGWHRLVGGVPGCLRCCTRVLYGAWYSRVARHCPEPRLTSLSGVSSWAFAPQLRPGARTLVNWAVPE